MEQNLSISRRKFLERTAALSALALVSGCSSPKLEATQAQEPEIPVSIADMEIKSTWCYMCGPAKTICATLCYMHDGKFVHVEGNPDAGNNWGMGCKSLCAKGNSAMQALYSPSRLQYPMKRVGAKGEGKFERCTWEEAIEGIATKLLENREKYGPESYAVLSPQESKILSYFGRRFLNVYGSPNYLHSAICQTQITSSRHISIGKTADTNPKQLKKTKLLVSWGVNGENADVNNRNDGANPVRRFDAVEAGMKFIDIRPMLDPLAAHADVWVPVRPGTDGALALAFLNVICEEGLYDQEFTTNWCNGFDKLSEYVKQFPPSWAAPITGIPEEQIFEVARMIGTVKPMGIVYGNSAGDQTNDGNWTCVSINLLAAITGNLDIPGGGGAGLKVPDPLVDFTPPSTLQEKLPLYDEDTANGWAASRSRLIAPEWPCWYQNPKTWAGAEPTGAYNRAFQSILTGEPYELKSIFGQASNPLSQTRQPKVIVEALKKLDFYFVMDTHWNPSCDYADYVLPACTRYEASCQIGTRNMEEGTYIGIEQQLVEPLGESRSDWQFYLDLAVAMGFGEDFWNGDMDACLEEQLKDSGVTLAELRAAPKGVFKERTDGAKSVEPQYQNYAKLFEKLPNGKVQCYNEIVGGMPNNRDDGTLEFLPVYVGPPEGLAETPELAKEYPLIFSDVHAHRLSIHSYFGNLPYLRSKNPYPWAKINPATAKQYGIEDGDWMKIESPHGWVKFVAEYFDGISPEVIMAKRGWWQDCEELGLPGYDCFDGGSEVNVLYDSTVENYDGFHSAMAKQTLVKISKVEG